MHATVVALNDWAARNFEGEPMDGWVRACTHDENDEPIIFRRRTDGKPESEYVAP